MRRPIDWQRRRCRCHRRRLLLSDKHRRHRVRRLLTRPIATRSGSGCENETRGVIQLRRAHHNELPIWEQVFKDL